MVVFGAHEAAPNHRATLSATMLKAFARRREFRWRMCISAIVAASHPPPVPPSRRSPSSSSCRWKRRECGPSPSWGWSLASCAQDMPRAPSLPVSHRSVRGASRRSASLMLAPVWRPLERPPSSSPGVPVPSPGSQVLPRAWLRVGAVVGGCVYPPAVSPPQLSPEASWVSACAYAPLASAIARSVSIRPAPPRGPRLRGRELGAWHRVGVVALVRVGAVLAPGPCPLSALCEGMNVSPVPSLSSLLPPSSRPSSAAGSVPSRPPPSQAGGEGGASGGGAGGGGGVHPT